MSGSRTGANRALVGVAICGAVAAAGLAGCGRMGQLEQPAPLYGTRAKADYDQRKAEREAARARHDASADERTDQEPPGSDNAPRTTREMQDPNQINTPASRAPIPGSMNDPFGPPPSTEPPPGR